MASGRHVLVIDDSLTIRKLLEMVLVQAGYDLELATSGTEGINRAKRRPPELLLLDYVLPDMKGIDVCHSLAANERTAQIPIVIMSAKSDDVRPQFRDVPSVIDFVSKPFTPPEIHFLVTNFFSRQPAPAGARAAGPLPGEPSFTIAQRESAAKAIYAKIKDRFARIPDWMPGLGSQAPALYFARKILTPDLMTQLMTALAPAFKEIYGQPDAAADPASVALLQGQTTLLQIPNLLSLLGGAGRTGELRIEQGPRTTNIYLRRGEVILVTHNQPDEYVRHSGSDLGGASSGEREAAWNEQKKAGKPLYVSLAEAGRMATKDLPDLLFESGRKILLETIEGAPGQFRWYDQHVLPAFVSAYGRTHALEQLKLERLRKVDDWTQVEMQVSSVDLVFQRCENFSKMLKQFDLSDQEKRVLTLVDGRNTVKQMIERSGVATFEVFHILFRMTQVGLIRKGVARAAAPAPAATSESRPVLILEPDVEGVQDPLGAKLRQRRIAVPLVSLNGEGSVAERIAKELPRLVVLNAAAGVDLEKTAREVRSTLEISDLPLVAVLEWEDAAKAEALSAAGYNAVLTKPLMYEDLDKLLAV